MKIFILSALILSIFFGNLNSESGNSDLEKIYQSILKSPLPDGKIVAVKKLLKTKECNDFFYTKKLLSDDHYWNREAAVFLISECNNRELDNQLIELYIDDNMVRNVIKNAIAKKPNRFQKPILDKYNSNMLDPLKTDYFSLLENLNGNEIEKFLQDIIQNTKSKDRVLAFQTLIKIPSTQSSKFLRSFINDKTLRILVLRYIIDSGDKSDLPTFKEILNKQDSPVEELAISCIAISKWESIEAKKKVYLRFLKLENQTMLPILFSIFDGIMDSEIFTLVSNLSRSGKSQSIRMEATYQLRHSKEKNRIAFIILYLQEEYQPQSQTSGGDILVNFMSLGISGMFKGLEEKNKKNKYDTINSDLIKYLQKETGEKILLSSEWRVWAKKNKYLPITITLE